MPQRRILLVDDEPALLRAYGAALRAAGYHVETAEDGVKARERAAGSHCDIVVTDIAMPGYNGVDLLRTIRARDPETPVILMTGTPAIETAVQALELGAFRYLLKPFPLSELVEAVGNAARLHDLALLKRQALQLTGHSDASERERMNQQLDDALAHMWMAYQPVVCAREGTVFAYEALFRTREFGPEHVLNAAERLGRLHELGRAVRRAVAQQNNGHTYLVNLHPEDLLDEALFQPGAPLSRIARNVILEVTERVALDDVPNVRTRVAELRRLGFRVAVDDLGAGYAGLGSLACLDPEIIKLDMGLIRNVHTDATRERLVRGMITLCHDLGKQVIGEGVELAEECNVLVDAKCDYLQGFLFARPSATTTFGQNLQRLLAP